MDQLSMMLITLMNIIIITLLIIIRRYQKEISKMKLEQSLTKKCINQSVKPDDLQILQCKYDTLMKILDNIQEGKVNDDIKNEQTY